MKNIDTVNRVVYKDFLLKFISPAIKAKWPVEDRGRPILIQQDNATPHDLIEDPYIPATGREDGWHIRVVYQPPNSPDFNVLNLGYFTAIQSLQYKNVIRNIEMLIKAVEDSFRNLESDKLDDISLILQQVMECCLRYKGGNDYKLPHMGKQTLRKSGKLSKLLTCDPAVYSEAAKLVLSL